MLRIFTLVCIYSTALSQNGRLQGEPTYMVLAPNRIRPDQVVNVHVSVFRINYPVLYIRVSIRKSDQEIAGVIEAFHTPSHRLAQLRVPSGSDQGNYTLLVEGTIGEYGASPVFTNETRLIFSPKRVSCFIFTDQHEYRQTRTVSYRLIAVHPNFLPASGSIDIFIKDAQNCVVRRWLSMQVNLGYFEGSFGTGYPANFGWWTTEVHGWGSVYKKTFFIKDFYFTRHEQLIKMPPYVMDNEYGITGTVKSQMTRSTFPIKGNATVTLQLTTKDGATDLPTLQQNFSVIDDRFSFNFPMDQIRNILQGDLENTGVHIHANVYDWYGMESKTEKSYTEILTSRYFLQFLGGKIRTFKPGEYFTVHIAVFNKAGGKFSASQNQMVRVQTIVTQQVGPGRQEEKIQMIGEDSFVHFTFKTRKQDQFIRIRASFTDSAGFQELTAYKHYSESGHYISISTSTLNPEVDTYLVFTLRTSIFIPEINYQVLGRGNILLSNRLFMAHSQKTFSIATSLDMVPNGRIVVWGVLMDGEVLADSLSFHVSDPKLTQMDVSVLWEDGLSRDKVQINVDTDGGSLVLLAAEQKGVLDMGVRPFLEEHQVYDDLSSYDDHVNNSFRHTWFGLGEDLFERTDVYFSAPSYAIDANTTFNFVGLAAITDAQLTRIPGAVPCNHSQGFLPCWDGSCYRIEAHCNGVRQCEDGADELGCQDPSEVKATPPDIFNNTDRRWNNLVQSRLWAWKRDFIRAYGQHKFNLVTPWRPETWLVSAVALHKDSGLRITKYPALLDTSRYLFMVVDMATVCKRGEQLGIQVSVFNTWNQTQEAIVMLVSSADFLFIKVNEVGLSSSYAPETITGDVQTLIRLEPNTSRQLHFPVLPIKIGTVSISIEVMSLTNKQRITKIVTVNYDGITNFYHTPLLVDLTSSGSTLTPYLEIPVPERFIKPGERRHLYVPGSEKAQVSIVGEIVGPGLYENHLTAKGVFGMVFGEGEYYLYNMAMNFFWLRFMKTTGVLTKTQLDATLEAINLDLQIVYGYMQTNGAFDIQRRSTISDTWFTSVVLDTLSRCVYNEWDRWFFIDINILNKVALWLCTRQDRSTGAFWNQAEQYDAKIKGDLVDENGKQANISLTAMAVLGLASSSSLLTGKAQSEALAAVSMGCSYLERWFVRLTDPFEVCLVTYTFHVANHGYRHSAFIKMRDLQRTGSGVYWSAEPIESNPVEFLNGVPYYKSRETPPPHQAKAVQATAYALMVYINNNWFSDAKPIMMWLQTQRNHKDGFAASQDSLAALQALMAYGEMETNRHLRHLAVHLAAASSPGWDHHVTFNQTDYMSTNFASVPKSWGIIQTWFEGTGLALYQLDVQVNVEYPDQIRQPQMHAFDLEVDSLLFYGRNGSLFSMNVCIRWVALQLGPKSGTAVLEVDIPTGYFVRKDVLIQYQRIGRIHSQRSRFVSQKVVMYFDYLDNNRSCFYFEGQRWYPVANSTIQKEIRVYDSYNPALYNRTLYTTYSLFHLHVCQVCGSFQCPYCPFYNMAESIIAQKGCCNLILIFAAFAVLNVILPHELWITNLRM